MWAIVGLIFVAIAAASEAVMDIIQFHYEESVFAKRNPNFWNPAISWDNKYEKGEPKLGPRFLGSTSIFVMFTDAWHLFKSLRTFSLFSAMFFVSLPNPNTILVLVVIYRIYYGLIFTVFYNKIFKK